jgi:hypothetical protein
LKTVSARTAEVAVEAMEAVEAVAVEAAVEALITPTIGPTTTTKRRLSSRGQRFYYTWPKSWRLYCRYN